MDVVVILIDVWCFVSSTTLATHTGGERRRGGRRLGQRVLAGLPAENTPPVTPARARSPQATPAGDSPPGNRIFIVNKRVTSESSSISWKPFR